MKASGAGAVMASRREPPDSLDFFPTPPWATRALCECVMLDWIRTVVTDAGMDELRRLLGTVWEPACGEGHMSIPLQGYADHVFSSDVFDYGFADRPIDFLGEIGAPAIEIDWIITNPPFNTAIDFALRALPIARVGVALLCRNNWIEGRDRYERLFSRQPPQIIAPFVERVPMAKGRWDPAGTTATAYTWFIWIAGVPNIGTMVRWIPPGQRQLLTRPSDLARFAMKTDAPLLDEARA